MKLTASEEFEQMEKDKTSSNNNANKLHELGMLTTAQLSFPEDINMLKSPNVWIEDRSFWPLHSKWWRWN